MCPVHLILWFLHKSCRTFISSMIEFSITMMNVKVNSASQISQSCSCILSFHRCSSLPRLFFYLRHYALHIISSCVTLFTAEKSSFRIRLNLIQCRQTFGLPHKTQSKRMGIFSGILEILKKILKRK